MGDAIFERDGELFIPTERALGPWSGDALHGGSIAMLLAHGVESAKADPALIVARLTMDLFRAVPRAPLRLETKPARTGRRIQALTTSILSGNTEVARATALLLLPSEVAIGGGAQFDQKPPEGPHGIRTGPLVPDEGRMSFGPGLHMVVEARRITEYGAGKGGNAIAWLRIPATFIEGLETTPLMHVAAASDFGNGLAHIRMDNGMGFINTDISLYLHREPVEGWVCLDVTSAAGAMGGVGLVTGTVFDEAGPVGVLTQALLANPGTPRPN